MPYICPPWGLTLTSALKVKEGRVRAIAYFPTVIAGRNQNGLFAVTKKLLRAQRAVGFVNEGVRQTKAFFVASSGQQFAFLCKHPEAFLSQTIETLLAHGGDVKL